jgi:hypothetical protein
MAATFWWPWMERWLPSGPVAAVASQVFVHALDHDEVGSGAQREELLDLSG